MPLVYCYCASVASIHTNPTTTWCISRMFDLKNRPLFDPKNRSMLVSAVAKVDDRLIAEWDRSQNWTAAPLLEHGIGPSLYC